MDCPFAWPEVIWRAEWGTYRGRDLSGHRVVDGGLLSNFPIKLLVSSDDYIDEIMGAGSASENVIGFLVDEDLPVLGVEEPLELGFYIPECLRSPRSRPGHDLAHSRAGGHDSIRPRYVH